MHRGVLLIPRPGWTVEVLFDGRFASVEVKIPSIARELIEALNCLWEPTAKGGVELKVSRPVRQLPQPLLDILRQVVECLSRNDVRSTESFGRYGVAIVVPCKKVCDSLIISQNQHKVRV